MAGLVYYLRIGPCCQLFPGSDLVQFCILDPVSVGLFQKDLHDLVHTGSCCQLFPEAGLVQSYRLDPASVWFVQEIGWLGPFLTDWTLLSVIPRSDLVQFIRLDPASVWFISEMCMTWSILDPGVSHFQRLAWSGLCRLDPVVSFWLSVVEVPEA